MSWSDFLEHRRKNIKNSKNLLDIRKDDLTKLDAKFSGFSGGFTHPLAGIKKQYWNTQAKINANQNPLTYTVSITPDPKLGFQIGSPICIDSIDGIHDLSPQTMECKCGIKAEQLYRLDIEKPAVVGIPSDKPPKQVINVPIMNPSRTPTASYLMPNVFSPMPGDMMVAQYVLQSLTDAANSFITAGTSTNGAATSLTGMYNTAGSNTSYVGTLLPDPAVIQKNWDALCKDQPLPRQPAPRTFNKYINASDMLEDFIKYLGEHGVKQSEFMGLPIELFIKWLIIKACEADNEEPNVTLELPSPRKQPRCLGCQKYMPMAATLLMHSSVCAGFYFSRERKDSNERVARIQNHKDSTERTTVGTGS